MSKTDCVQRKNTREPEYNDESIGQRPVRTRVSDAQDGHAVELTAGSPEVIVVWRKRQDGRLGRGGQ